MAWGAIIAAGAALIGGYLDRKGSKKADTVAFERQGVLSYENFKNQWGYKRAQGLTPQEIVGTPTAGVPSVSNTLGSNQNRQQAVQQATQLQFQARENRLDRENRIDVVNAQQEVPRGKLDIEIELTPLNKEKLRAQTKEILVQTKLTQWQLDNAYPVLIAKMGPANMIATLAAANSGISQEALIKGDPQNKEAVKQLYQQLVLMQDSLGRKVLTIPEMVKLIKGMAKSLVDSMKFYRGRKVESETLGSPKFKRDPDARENPPLGIRSNVRVNQ